MINPEHSLLKGKHFRLASGFNIGRIGGRSYIYDYELGMRGLLQYETSEIAEPVLEVLRELAKMEEAISFQELSIRLVDNCEIELTVHDLLKSRLIDVVEIAPELSTGQTGAGSQFSKSARARSVAPDRFFNVPELSASDKPDVAIKSFPLATHAKNKGTEAGPAYLRYVTSSYANWFDLHRDGIFSDLCFGSGVPTIGQGLVLADFGDIEVSGKSLDEIFDSVNKMLHEEFIENGIRPIIVGGDHSITFPIVDSLHKHDSRLCVLHLDAHHDLFFGARLQFSHASLINNLLFHTRIDSIYSFGMRARMDFVGPQANELLKLNEVQKWWSRVSTIHECRRIISRPSRLDDLLSEDLERPFYLTLDLDVLSPEAISGRVMTPVDDGLSWSELFELLNLLFDRLDVVGCDVTELNPYRGTASSSSEESLCLLMVYLIEKMGRTRYGTC